MADRNQNGRQSASSRDQANIQSSGFIEGWRPRYQHYTERIGSTASPTKILKPKSGNLEVLIRTRDESVEQNIQICEPYEKAAVDLHTPYTLQNLKNMFQKPLEFNFGDEMYSSSVIGWASENGDTILINRIFLGITDEDIVPLTETIFPVLVMGKYEMPVLNETCNRDYVEYEPGFYLILRNAESIKSFTVEIEVQKGSTPNKIRVQTHRALLGFYNFHILWDKNKQKNIRLFRYMGSINRILDIDNTAYGIYGMYGGGPLPPREQKSAGMLRLTWDQPRNSEVFGLRAMESCFRYGIDHQHRSQRTGFYCSRDALLVVSEEIHEEPFEKKMYRSLLKEYTYVIIDGVSEYAMFHCQGNPQRSTFGNQTGPIIVIVPQGVSSLRILQDKEKPFHRKCRYFNENSTLPPMVIKWKVFQNDFN